MSPSSQLWKKETKTSKAEQRERGATYMIIKLYTQTLSTEMFSRKLTQFLSSIYHSALMQLRNTSVIYNTLFSEKLSSLTELIRWKINNGRRLAAIKW